MTDCKLMWYVLIGILFAGFFFLEGFDFGVGMSVQSLTHNEQEKRSDRAYDRTSVGRE